MPMEGSKGSQSHRLESLPHELAFEIFHRLPIKSLIRSKLVSKYWNSLISSPTFAKFYIQFSTNNPKPLSLFLEHDHYFSLLKSDEEDEDDYGGLRVMGFSKGLHLTILGRPFPVGACIGFCDTCLGSCDGLICIFRRCMNSFYIWNPTTNGRSMRVPFPRAYLSKKVGVSAESWFGFVPSINDYIIVLFSQIFDHIQVHVYSMKDAKWRKLGVTISVDNWVLTPSYAPTSRASFINEALHYGVIINPYGGNDRFHKIIKFDLVQETFVTIPVDKIDSHDENENDPIIEKYGSGHIQHASLTILDEKICYWQIYEFSNGSDYYLSRLEMWKLEEYGKWDSWKKIYKVDFEPNFWGNYPKVLGFITNTKVVITTAREIKIVDINKDPPTCVRLNSQCKYFGPMVSYTRSVISPFMLSS